MVTMGCVICRVKQDIAQSPQGVFPVCHRHPNRILVDWRQIESHPEDPWLGLILNQRYELLHPLGKGGFGSVYFAVQRGHIRYPVAIKLLTRKSPEYFDLFKDEMRVISRLKSPHTVRYLDSGTHHDEHGREIPFMVMNFIEGETLAHRIIRDGALAPRDVIAMLRQLMHSLEEAHQQGIVHRDLKPLNLMINQKTSHPLTLVVLDFGVARILDEASREATQNRIMGTPYYLAPETLIEQKVSPATDLFAAAVIAYEAICCRSPFLNEELQGIEPYLKLRKLYRKNTKPNPLPDKFSREWRLFFECALAIDPMLRFPNASSILIALDELERLEQAHAHAIRMETDDFEEEEVTTFFKRHLVGESLDEETLQSMSEFDSSHVLETLQTMPPPLPEWLMPHPPPLQSEQRAPKTLEDDLPKFNRDLPETPQIHKLTSNESLNHTQPKESASAEHAPTMQMARPSFLEISIQNKTPPYYPPKKPYSNSGVNRYQGENIHQRKSSDGWFSMVLLLVQLALMVGLGALFAYIMIRYVLV